MTTAVRTAPHHNTLTCYTDYRCRRPECVARARAYEARRREGQATGTWQPLVDAEEVRQHLLKLHAVGITIYRVAALTGLGDNTVRGFTQQTRAGERINGRRKRTTREVADKILSIDPDKTAPGRIDPTGSVRRLQALIAIGWPLKEIARRTGMSDQTMYNVARQELILASTAADIAAIYEQFKARRPSTHTISAQQRSAARNRAASHRWPPPAYWDQTGAIDDVDFQPQYGIPAAQVFAEEARWLMTAGGLDLATAAARLHRSRGYIKDALRDHPPVEQQAAA